MAETFRVVINKTNNNTLPVIINENNNLLFVVRKPEPKPDLQIQINT